MGLKDSSSLVRLFKISWRQSIGGNAEEEPKVSPATNPSVEGESEWDRIIHSLAATLADHPGFMLTAGGFEVLHADWPAYPQGHGVRTALANLGEFPADTTFFAVDRIDQCTLFVVGSVLPKDPYNRTHYHLAIWDEDLRTCLDRGFIEGPSIDSDGSIVFTSRPLSVTPQGQFAILVDELTRDIRPTLLKAVGDFLYLKRFDVAVREAALFVETTLRRSTGSTASGQKLIEECFGAAGRML